MESGGSGQGVEHVLSKALGSIPSTKKEMKNRPTCHHDKLLSLHQSAKNYCKKQQLSVWMLNSTDWISIQVLPSTY
jgi:hypothetical protein